MAFTDFIVLEYFNNTIMQYLIFLGIAFGGFIVAKTGYWLIQKFLKVLTQKSKTKMDDIIVDMVEEPAVVYLVLFFVNIGWNFLSFPDYPGISLYYGHIFYMVLVLNSAWLISRLVVAILDNFIKPLTEKSKTDLDDHLLPILKKTINIIAFVVAAIMILQHFGQEIGPMLAGLGIGGLAFALAAKDLLSNIFGSITVIMDKPFTMGDRIKIDGEEGVVEEINLRTTKMQTLEGRKLYVPNARFTDGIVENVSKEWARKISMTIGVVYDTNATGMKKAKDIIQKAIENNKETDKENIYVAFDSFGDFSKNISIIYWITAKGYENIIKVKDDINMEIMVEFEKAKIDMAFPTQTIELKK